VEVLVKFVIEQSILSRPSLLILVNPKRMHETGFAERRLSFFVLCSHLFFVFLKIFVFNFVLVVLGLDMNLSAGISKLFFIVNKGLLVWRDHSGLAHVVASSKQEQHQLKL